MFTCLCLIIYKVEGISPNLFNYTFRIHIFVSMWHMGTISWQIYILLTESSCVLDQRPSWRYTKRVCNMIQTPTHSVQFNQVNDSQSMLSFTLNCYEAFNPRGIEESLVLPPRWPLIQNSGTLYNSVIKVQIPFVTP